jgi:hypothetical protein
MEMFGNGIWILAIGFMRLALLALLPGAIGFAREGAGRTDQSPHSRQKISVSARDSRAMKRQPQIGQCLMQMPGFMALPGLAAGRGRGRSAVAVWGIGESPGGWVSAG